jgi:hypothetical protein
MKIDPQDSLPRWRRQAIEAEPSLPEYPSRLVRQKYIARNAQGSRHGGGPCNFWQGLDIGGANLARMTMELSILQPTLLAWSMG